MLSRLFHRATTAARSFIASALIDAAGAVSPSLQRHVLFIIVQHRFGDFRRPRTFSEKINWRILNDRRTILGVTCDKMRAKDLAVSLGLRVPATIWHGGRLAELTEVKLPPRWVLKPNDGSGSVFFGSGPLRDVAALEAVTRTWLRARSPVQTGEWAYTLSRAGFLVEEMLDEEQATPTSYKFFVFDGQTECIAVIAVGERQYTKWKGSGSRHWPPHGTQRRFYTPTWEPLEVCLGELPLAEVVPPPDTLSEMLAAASLLGRDYDFMRVDLYSVGGQVYFSELTPYPSAGVEPFMPREFDSELGSHWRLPQM
jgi:hypothetical protein